MTPKRSVSFAPGTKPSADAKSCSAKPTVMPRKAPKRSVSFASGTKPPAEPNHISIIPQTEIWLRNCQVFIPVQIFDMIILRLAPTNSPNHFSPTTLFHQHIYRQPPYIALLHDLTFVTSFPLTPHMIAEIQEMRNGRPASCPNAHGYDSQIHELWKEFDEMHSKFITLQRERVRAAQKFHRFARSDTARIDFQNVQQAEQRIEKDRQTLSEAQLKGQEMEAESKHLWSQLQTLRSSLDN